MKKVGELAHKKTQEAVKIKYGLDISIEDAYQYHDEKGRQYRQGTRTDIEHKRFRVIVELKNSLNTSNPNQAVARDLQFQKQLEVARATGSHHAIVEGGKGGGVTFHSNTEIVEMVPHTNIEKAHPTSNVGNRGSGNARGYATLETLGSISGGMVIGGLGALMVYTAMKEAELQAEEQNSFKPIQDETTRQVGGLVGGLAAAKVGAVVGIPAGPVGMLAGFGLGLAGGFFGYSITGALIAHQDQMESDPEYRAQYERDQNERLRNLSGVGRWQ
jgi:hypothetical protein